MDVLTHIYAVGFGAFFIGLYGAFSTKEEPDDRTGWIFTLRVRGWQRARRMLNLIGVAALWPVLVVCASIEVVVMALRPTSAAERGGKEE